jgi:hypothetical protein
LLLSDGGGKGDDGSSEKEILLTQIKFGNRREETCFAFLQVSGKVGKEKLFNKIPRPDNSAEKSYPNANW